MATKQTDLKPKCKYGAKCYRRNAGHLKAYSHPKRKSEEDEDKEEGPDPGAGDQPKKARVELESTSSEVKGDKQGETTEKEEDRPAVEEEVSDTDEEEEDDNQVSPTDYKEYIKHKFLLEMPKDFYEFWEFCKTEKADAPADALKKVLGYHLVGPYDILAGKHEGVVENKRGKKPNFLCHWRYYYDPPEFLTVIRGDDEAQFHIGYYRDDPKEMPVFLAANFAKTSCTLIPRGDNIFAAVNFYLKEKVKSKDVSGSCKKSIESMSQRLSEWAGKHGLSLDVKTKPMKDRQKKVVCDTFHGAGIVVHVDENEVGYRPVPETPGDLKKILKKIVESKTEKERNENFDPLQELITLIQFANDECDYGEGLELGLDLFSYGGKVFHSTILHLLPLAYQLLRRPQYAKVITAHLRHRRHDADLSELE